MVYKSACVLFALVLLFLPQRGIPHNEIRVLCTVLGVDGRAGAVQVSAQLAVPVAQNGDGKASTVAKAEGGSLCEALENLEIGLGRRVDYGHLSTVVVGKDVTLIDLRMFTGHLMSSGKAGPGAYLVYSSRSPAHKFIADAQSMGESSDAELSSVISYSKSGNHVPTTTVLRFLQTLHSVSNAAFLPCVALEEDGEEGGGGQGEEESSSKQKDTQQEEQGGASGGGKGGGANEKKKLVAADSVAVFGGESETGIVLDAGTTRGVVWQDRHSDFGLVELRNTQLDGLDLPSIAARLTGKSVRRTVRTEHGENVLTYHIKIKLRLDDSQICGNSLFYNKWKNTLEKEYESVIRNNIQSAVEASKRTGIDFLGLRAAFHKYDRKGFDAFDLQTVVVNVDARASIRT